MHFCERKKSFIKIPSLILFYSIYIYILGKKRSKFTDPQPYKEQKNTKLKDKISSSFFKRFLVRLISSYFHCLLPRFKGSH